MFPANFIKLEHLACQLDLSSKKRVLQHLGEMLSAGAGDISPDSVFDHLLERERLGSTGMGHGIALPHARIEGLAEARGGFIRLVEGVDFGAVDGEPVDMIFGLLVPGEATEAHLKLLATLAGLFRDAGFCADLRQADSLERVLQRLLTG